MVFSCKRSELFKKSLKVFIAVFLLFLIFGLFFLFIKKPKPSIEKKNTVYVRTITAQLQDVPLQLNTLGTCIAYDTVSIKPRLDSQITKIYVKNGDYVQKDQILFELDNRVIQSKLDKQKANLEGLKARLIKAKNQLERNSKLTNKGFASQEKHDEAKAFYEETEASVRATEASIQNQQVLLDYTSIRSPIAGKIGTIFFTEGSNVKVNDSTLVTINTIKPMWVQLSIPHRYYDLIKQSLYTPIKVIAKKADHLESYEGTLKYIENTIDTATGTFSARAVFPNDREVFWPGMFVDVTLILGLEKEKIVLPSTAVQVGQDQNFVFIASNTNKAVKRPVEVLRYMKDQVVLKSGVLPGEQLVIDGFLRLYDGALVETRSKGENS